MRRFGIFAAAGLLAVAASNVTAQEVPTVAVIGIGAFSVALEDATAMGNGLTDMITTELSERPEVRTVDRQTFDEVMRRQGASVGAGISDEAAIQIGRMLGATFIVRGNAALDRRTARLDLRVIDVETSAVVKSVKETGDRENLLELAERIAALLVTDLELPERPETITVEIPVAASLAYSRGLDYERRGRRDRAEAMYRRTLEVYPQHPHAQAALDRVN